ncbi:hypothetical protein ACFHWD_12000 [Clostridium sp. MT-14]|jgi:hypothetical protein|uniref:Uncharacterized protein n=1 Tax=Clostridium aromativorans TaxID=2836848 RepID=A0ABS8NBU6_9CLOT|nr:MULTISPECIES: hypothetical protein [Clostridium]KAA8669119.1 hypothetical protein F3O63_13690 [Clostridium sp. HV4-5-A1G]MCC9296654.1 hypothetical protein [Clostridium aromativorans]CAB1251278.1 conserved hypothetical protein [Clostridiaceae bacterium BL-3]
MLFFLYISGFLAVLVGIKLFYKQNKKIANKNYSEKKILQYWIKRMIVNITTMCLTAIFVLFIVPLLIWIFAPKETGTVDKILESKNLTPISSSNKNSYIKEVLNGNAKSCLVNIDDNGNQSLQNFNSKSVEIVSTDKEKPKYERIAEYKIKKLKGNWIIPNSVNDIYANVYIDYSQKNFIRNKVKLIVPANSK